MVLVCKYIFDKSLMQVSLVLFYKKCFGYQSNQNETQEKKSQELNIRNQTNRCKNAPNLKN